MAKHLKHMLFIVLMIICHVNSQCCDQQCRNYGNTLDCDGVCQENRLCKISNHITELYFRNNSLGTRTNLQFPYHSKLRFLHIGFNDLTNIVSSSIFISFQNLEGIDLEGNKFNMASLYVPFRHKLKRIRGLETNCMNTNYLDNLYQLDELEVTLTGIFCKEILMNSLEKIVITLKTEQELTGDNFERLGNIKSITLNLPLVHVFRENDFRHFSKIEDLTLNAPLLTTIEGNILKQMSKLTKFNMQSPNLKYLPADTFVIRNRNESSKLTQIELCPVTNLPNDLFLKQTALTSIKLCGFSERTYLGIRVENSYKKISLSDSILRTRLGSLYDSTLYLLVNDKPTFDPDVKIKTESLSLVRMSLRNNDWSMKFKKDEIIYLDLSYNELNSINLEYKDFNNLTHLDLSHNKIAFISYNAFPTLTNLRLLRLSNNLLETLDLTIFNTKFLNLLDCSQNLIRSVAPETKGITFVKIKLSNNKIESIDELFKGSQTIKSITLTNNSITHIPQIIPKSLQRLFLTNNPINCSCENIEHLNDLTEKLVENDQMSVVRSLRYAKCDNQVSGILDQAQRCSNISNTEDVQINLQVQNSDINDIFRPEIGVLVKDFAKITSGNNLITATLILEIPEIHVPKTVDVKQVERICKQQDGFLKKPCEEIIAYIEEHIRELRNTRFEIYDKLISIHKIAFQDDKIHSRRKKRFVLEGIKAISNIAVTFSKIYSEYITRKQVKAMGKAVEVMQSKVLTNTQQILTIKKEMALYQSQNLKHFMAIENEINSLRNSTDELTRKMSFVIDSLNDEIVPKMRAIGAVAFSNRVINKVSNLIGDNFRVYDTLLSELNHLLITITQLKQGILSPVTFSPKLMQNVLDKARALLDEELPEYKLVFDEVHQYYSVNNLAFSVSPEVDSILVQVPLFLTLKNLDFLKLYHLTALRVPLNSQRTQIILDHPYLANNEEHYVSFTQEQFQLCKSHAEQKIYICPYDLILRKKSSVSCESLLVNNGSLSEIYEQCNIHFFPEETPHVPEMLQFDNKIVLTDIHQPVSWQCLNGENKNENISSKNLGYTIIETDALCGCDLQTKEFLIPKKSCPQNLDSSKLQFVINSMAYCALKNHIVQNFSDDALTSLYDYIPDVKFPTINLSVLAEKDPLFYLERDVALDLKDVIQTFEEDHKVNLITEKDLTNIHHLFVGKAKVIGYALALAVIGSLGIFLTIFICKRQLHLRKLTYALVSNFVPMTEAKNNSLIVIDSWSQFVTTTLIILITTIVLQLLLTISRKIIHKILHYVPALQVPKSLQSSDHVKLYLILRTTNCKINIPLCTIPTQIDMVKLENGFGIDNLMAIRNGLKYYLSIEWSSDRSNLVIENLTIGIPNKIPINMWTARKIRQIHKSDIMMSLNLIDSSNLMYVLQNRLYTPKQLELETIGNKTRKGNRNTLKMKKNLLLNDTV